LQDPTGLGVDLKSSGVAILLVIHVRNIVFKAYLNGGLVALIFFIAFQLNEICVGLCVTAGVALLRVWIGLCHHLVTT
jgi:hypothetical protein